MITEVGELLTIAEVMSELKISRRTVYNLIDAGKLEPADIAPRATRVTKRSVRKLVQDSLRKGNANGDA